MTKRDNPNQVVQDPSSSNMVLFGKAWSILDMSERRNAFLVLIVVVVAAAAAALMIGSVMPFLAVLSDPSQIHSSPLLSAAYRAFQFETEFSFLLTLGIGSLVVIFVSNLLQIFRIWAVQRFATMRVHALSKKLLSAYLRQPYEYFVSNNSDVLSTQILSESQQYVQSFLRPVLEAVAAGITILAIIALLLVIDPTVTGLALLVLGLSYAIIYLVVRSVLARLGKVRARANRLRFKVISEAFGGVKHIKLRGAEQHYIDMFEEPSSNMSRANTAVNVLGEAPHYIMQFMALGAIIGLCLFLVQSSQNLESSTITDILPTLGVFAFAGQRLMPELSKLYRGITQLRYGAPAVESIYADLNFVEGRVQNVLDESQRLVSFTESIELSKLSYEYPGSERSSLNAIDLKIKRGEKVGVVGSTGAGKTTLADVLLGLLIPSSGRLLVDGVAIDRGNRRDWQNIVGYVPQDIYISDSTIAENVAIGVPAGLIDRERVVTSCKIARIHDFIVDELEQGYDTRAGEKGVRFSGGQRQRLGIARSFYHNSELIVFDEATSALDGVTESAVMSAIASLPGEKTIVLIAHRLSTVEACDKIIVLKDGEIEAIGSWSELVAKNPTFLSLVNAGTASGREPAVVQGTPSEV